MVEAWKCGNIFAGESATGDECGEGEEGAAGEEQPQLFD